MTSYIFLYTALLCRWFVTLLVYSLHVMSAELIALSGDVHPNPGPEILDNSTSSMSDVINKGLSIMHLNIQSLRPKLDILEVEAQQFDILVFSETWLSDQISDDDLHIPNFSPPFRCDRVGRIGGGVAIYTRQGIPAVERKDLHVQGLEALWIEITVKSRKLLIGGFYRPPDANNNYWQLIEHSIDQAFSVNCDNIIVTGDFNINVQHTSNKLSRLISSYNGHQLINSPTHFTETTSSTIDIIFVKSADNVIKGFVSDPFIPNLTRFHCPVVCVLKCNKSKPSNYKRRIWLYDQGNYDEFRNQLSSKDWSFINNDNTDAVADEIADTILKCASNTIPNKIVTIRPNDLPHINNNIRKLIKTRRKLHSIAKRVNTVEAWTNFKNARNKVTTEVRKSKSKHKDKLLEKLNTENCTSKDWYKTAKQMTKNKLGNQIPLLSINNTEASTNEQKANMLNDFFCSQANIDDSHQPLPNINSFDGGSLEDIVISEQDVKDAISQVDPSKACGPDLISPRLLREGSDILAKHLSIFFTKLVSSSAFPTTWKVANVTPIFKKGDPSTPSNYRPVSLLSCIGKLMERCIHTKLYNYVFSNRLITPHQSGFVKGDSTVNQLTLLYNEICQALDDGKEVKAVFCDISKAFDRVWHKGLILKLSSIGIKGPLLRWFPAYLSDRKQRVVVSNSLSSLSNVTAGVPQGSILGPLLFLIFINDIVTDIDANIRLFADDTSLSVIVETPETAAHILNSDLQKITNWASTWLVDFNATKTESLLFSKKRNRPIHPPLVMNNTPIATVKTHKHLGINFSDDAKWKEHITAVLNKAWRRLGILRTYKFLVSRKCLEKMYITFIRPLLEYGDVVWNNCNTELKNQIESVQVEAARIVTGATKLCNIQSLLSDLGWETLASRRRSHRLILIYKMINHLAPEYLSNLIPTQTQNRYPLRNSENIPLPATRTELYASSFLPATIRDWNSLSIETRNSPSISTFKRRLRTLAVKPPSYYNTGSRRGQILHCRLRLGCSSLNFDLFRKNLSDSSSCICGKIETTSHFLLECILHSAERRQHINNLPCGLILNNLLFGNEQLTHEQNQAIFLGVQNFILATRRFGP